MMMVVLLISVLVQEARVSDSFGCQAATTRAVLTRDGGARVDGERCGVGLCGLGVVAATRMVRRLVATSVD